MMFSFKIKCDYYRARSSHAHFYFYGRSHLTFNARNFNNKKFALKMIAVGRDEREIKFLSFILRGVCREITSWSELNINVKKIYLHFWGGVWVSKYTFRVKRP